MAKIILEVGHGPYRTRNGKVGFEEGANGPGTTEYKEVKIMAELAQVKLTMQGYDVEVLDPEESLKKIGQLALGSNIFVSLHLNAFNRMAQGTEVLIHRAGTKEDHNLAEVLQEELVKALGLTDRGVKRQGLAVLSQVPSSVQAACLTESFFIDSVADAETVRTMSETAAHAIATGIDRYIKTHGLDQDQ
ncbi:N-acetylmuramoyl-L-alanine amidase [filamentous cyanobacterium LEGE 11480]|uniref:N-acetylmuramoyl-L-alanine amidase n=1 Tax=Romeriopsis navalis LEGE 11480 TaxID=2777977 RepID=A0A928VWU5_9CYAN|nr:N-acetylmuramoyl-L-alanine amidase [Romeriopsis navalis]MBE9033489.1 N-acetylmuramoyl-L-alanine amidase [Romeriopsis navalis LEGE 11480]